MTNLGQCARFRRINRIKFRIPIDAFGTDRKGGSGGVKFGTDSVEG